MRQRLALMLCLFLSHPVQAELSGNFRALTLNMPPFSVSVDPARQDMQGYFGEIFVAAMRQAGLMKPIAVDMIAWKRAQQLALSEKNIVLFPLIRTAAREDQYHWLALILEEPCYAWNIDPSQPIDSWDDIFHAGKIGGLAGGPQTNEVRRLLGPQDAIKVEDSETEELALRKLLAGRIQVWSAHSVTANYVAQEYARTNHLPPIHLHRGYKLFDANVWMAVSKGTAEPDVAQLQQALAHFLQTPEYQQINRKYHIEGRRYRQPEAATTTPSNE